MTVVISKNLNDDSAYTNSLNTTGIYIFKYLCTYIICYNSNNIRIKDVCPVADDAPISKLLIINAWFNYYGKRSPTI